MKYLIVASVKTHAEAMLKWLKHDSEKWNIMCYGDPVKGVFAGALLVRPIGEITDDHALWVHEVLKPRIFGPIEASPGWVSQQTSLEDLSHEI